MSLEFEKYDKNKQATGYNGTHTVNGSTRTKHRHVNPNMVSNGVGLSEYTRGAFGYSDRTLLHW